jgi:hypothetical protein
MSSHVSGEIQIPFDAESSEMSPGDLAEAARKAIEDQMEGTGSESQDTSIEYESPGIKVSHADSESSLGLVLVDVETEEVYYDLEIDLMEYNVLTNVDLVVDRLMEAFGGGGAKKLYQNKLYMATYGEGCTRNKFQGVRPVLDENGTAQVIFSGLPFERDNVENLQEALIETKREFLYS